MADIYSFTEEEKETINYLKQIVTVKYGSCKNFKFKIEKYIFQKKIYKTVILYAPQSFNENTVEAYILKNKDIIYKLAYHCFYPKKTKIPHDKILYLGRLYNFKLKPEIHNTYNIDEENLIIYAGKNLLNRENLIKFYHKQASYIFPARVSMCAEKIKLNIKAVKTGVFKTYWGSCGAGIIKLNERLVLSPLNTIDSIIYHELAHILVPNHSKEFYTVLEKIYPSYYKDHIWLTLFMPAEYPPKTVE